MFNTSILTIGFLRKKSILLKKTLLSLTLIILSVYSLASCKEYSIAGTYSEEPPSPEYESRIRIRINTDNSIESFFDGEWHNIGIAKVNKKNKNFIISDGDGCLFGFLSDNDGVLFTGEGIPLLNEEKASQPIWGSVYSSNNLQIKFTENQSLEVLQHDGESKNIGDVLYDKKTGNFVVYDLNPLKHNNGDTVPPAVIGFFSEDKKTLYLSVDCFALNREEIDTDTKKITVENKPTLPNPKLTFDSVDVSGISFKSSMSDLILQYPASRIINKDECKQYLVDELENFDYIRFDFKDNSLVHILKYKSEGEYENRVAEIVQKSVNDLTRKYGKPEIEESSLEYPSYKKTEYERTYTWYGEVFIRVEYTWYSDEYGHTSYGTCNIDYALNIVDLF